jgi:hypothetical protein
MKALSIRQPWAWLILHAQKDIENRTWATKFRGPVLIHASQTMTKADYEACEIFCQGLEGYGPWWLPHFDACREKCGGIVGQVEIVDCVNHSDSCWFTGPVGFVLAKPSVLPFRPMKGRLGFFNVEL